MSRERPTAGPLRLWLFVIGGILVLGLGLLWLRSGAKPTVPGSDEAARGGLHPEETPPGHGNGAITAPSAAAGKRKSADNVPAAGDDDELVWVDPATLTPEQIAERRAKRLRMAADGHRDYYRYPPSSRPLSDNEDLLLRDHVEPEIRKLKRGEDGEKGEVRLELWQNKMFLREGDEASFRVKAATQKGPVPVNVVEATLVTLPDEGTAPQNLGPLSVTDDGSPPDEISNDGVPTGGFVASASRLGSYRGNLRVMLKLEAEGEQGTATLQFVYTGAEPGRFTGEVVEALEDGSLALYFGLELKEAGRYEIRARLYDKSDRPVALLNFNQDLEVGKQKARLLAFGKLLRDEGAEGPYTIRDIEGWRLLSGTYPDREMMQPPEDYTTKEYSLDQFSDAEYSDPQAEAMIEHIENAQKTPPPAPSN
ncbi:MAG: hypothetical protein H6718_03085 [Polyangiaceae bacterium]|nr:hypothetical protein [Polyangiaceae bacterium]